MTTYLKITVKTPKNQAAKCMQSQKEALLGFKKTKSILEEKLINDHEFYWIIPSKDDKETYTIQTRLNRGERFIKTFYKTLIKVLDRANKLATKLKKGTKWIKKWLLKRLKKTYQDPNNGLVKQIEDMSEEELKEFIKINDKEAIQKLMRGNLIDVETVPKPTSKD